MSKNKVGGTANQCSYKERNVFCLLNRMHYFVFILKKNIYSKIYIFMEKIIRFYYFLY